MEKRSFAARAVANWGPPAASAGLMALAFTSAPLGWLVFIALVPWLRSLCGLDGKASWRMGYRYGFLFALTQLHWFGTLAYRWTHSPILAVLPWVVGSAMMAVYYGLLGVVTSRALRLGVWWLAPLTWAGVEVFRSYIPIFAFPWNLLATPLTQCLPLAQLGFLGGVYLASAWVFLANALLAIGDGWQPRARRSGAIALGVGLVATLTLFFVPRSTENARVTIVQPGVDMAFGDRSQEFGALLSAFEEANQVARLERSEFILLPEGVAGRVEGMPPRIPYPLAEDVPALFGGQFGTDPVYQAAFAWDHDSWQRVFKTRLVVFGEFVPFRSAIPFIEKAFSLPSGDVSAGSEGVHAVRLGTRVVGPVICFEGLFPDVSYRQALNGSSMLAQLSIDDWYMDTSAIEQLRQAAVWRSIETGLPLVRSASLGYSMVVDGKGVVRYQAPLKERRIQTIDVPIPRGRPAPWPAFTAALFAATSFFTAAAILFVAGPKRAQKPSSSE